ncbi:MAG: 4Fe-4S cluster-binding domain-containing protein, partial [Gammaproteobacteria bacterium]|nr:4Fe-4S cluster-binding domain-containing protein [Gammaproteobacteria bacterium]
MANLMNLDVLRAGRLEARAPRYQVYTERHLDQIDVLSRLPDEERFAMRVVASVLPFRVNNYVIDELIDWDRVPDDPIYQLVFPQRGMLGPEDFTRMAAALENGADRAAVHALAQEIRKSLNPHPAGQQTLNVPTLDGERLPGMQHKYRETLLFFPSQGQVCHAYCTFCFRWAQFVGDKSLRFATNEADRLKQYLRAHREITDVLITGGDPMVMNADHLAAYLAPLVAPELDHIETIRIGTKSLTFWPHRYVSDTDADEVLRLFERLVEAGKHVALMAHYDHWREMETPVAQEAVRRIRDTGAVIRTQAPLLRWINDDPEIWARMWQAQVRLGMVPYYMFV